MIYPTIMLCLPAVCPYIANVVWSNSGKHQVAEEARAH